MEDLHYPAMDQGWFLSKLDWLTLSFIKGVGPARLDRLFTYIETLEQALMHDLNPEDEKARDKIDLPLLIALKWPKKTAEQAIAYLQFGKTSEQVDKQLALTQLWLSKSKQHYLVMRSEPDYPYELSQISVAPLFLYIQGELAALNKPKLAMVGARKATSYGIETAFNLAKELAEQGISVVSGGAIGIDTSSHQGALSCFGSTIAVMGAGLLNLYPKNNQSLFASILEQQGCLISEYPLNTQVQARLFPARNRIISGLSLGVIVVEAGFKSGSLISASYALQHNRDVFAVPGRINDPASVACLDLIKQGAKLITQASDVLAEYTHLKFDQIDPVHSNDLKFSKPTNVYPTHLEHENKLVSRETGSYSKPIPCSFNADKLNKSELKIITTMDDALIKNQRKNEFELDQLVMETKLTIEEVMQACMQLELDDLISSLMTGYARKMA